MNHEKIHQEVVLIFLHDNQQVRKHDVDLLEEIFEAQEAAFQAYHVDKSRAAIVADFRESTERAGVESDDLTIFDSFEEYASARLRCGSDGCDCPPIFPERDLLLLQYDLLPPFPSP